MSDALLSSAAVARQSGGNSEKLLAHYIGTPGVAMALNHTQEPAAAKAPAGTGGVDPTRR